MQNNTCSFSSNSTFFVDNKKNAEEEYKKAEATGKEHLVSTDPILLGLFLNFSVFYYEIAKNQKKACELAKRVSYSILMGRFLTRARVYLGGLL